MTEFLDSTTSCTYDDYNKFNRYYKASIYYHPNDSITEKPKKEPLPKKEEVHIFDIKDLDL